MGSVRYALDIKQRTQGKGQTALRTTQPAFTVRNYFCREQDSYTIIAKYLKFKKVLFGL